MTVVLRIAAPLFPDWMCVIESNDSFAVSTMQCQRIVQPVRSLRCWRNLFYHESNPVSALRVDNESQSIQIEQRVEAQVNSRLNFRVDAAVAKAVNEVQVKQAAEVAQLLKATEVQRKADLATVQQAAEYYEKQLHRFEVASNEGPTQ